MTTPPNGTQQQHNPDGARYLSIAKTKNLLIADVRASFPNTKFSFRTRINTLIIEWTDGPAWRNVKKVAGIFTSRGTIDNNDYVSSLDTWYNGELVYFWNDYVELIHNFSHNTVETVAQKYQEYTKCDPFIIIDGSKGSGIEWTHLHHGNFLEVLRALDEEQYQSFTLKMDKERVIIEQIPLCTTCKYAYIDDTTTKLCNTCTKILADRARYIAIIETPLPESATLIEQLNLVEEKYYACFNVIYTFGEDTALHEQYNQYYTDLGYQLNDQANRLLAMIERTPVSQRNIIDFEQAKIRRNNKKR